MTTTSLVENEDDLEKNHFGNSRAVVWIILKKSIFLQES
jgi:hypothetical protein